MYNISTNTFIAIVYGHLYSHAYIQFTVVAH